MAWLAHLDPELSRFRVDGEGRVWGGQLSLCDGCRALLVAGDGVALGALLVARDADDDSGRGPEDPRPAVDALRAAYRSATPVAEWLPPGVEAATAEGFVLLEDLTGWYDVVAGWPSEHVRLLPETRPDWLESGLRGQVPLLRSPWPGVDVRDVMAYLIRWADQHGAFRDGDVTPERRAEEAAIIRDFFVAFDTAFRQEWEAHLKEWM